MLGWGSTAQTNKTEVIHPLGEGDFSFAAPGGRVRRSETKDALTPFGGLVPGADDLNHRGMVDNLVAECPEICAFPAPPLRLRSVATARARERGRGRERR